MDLHREWLKEAMPARAVSAQALTQHRAAITRVLGHTLSIDDARLFKVLLARMEKN
jgi:hypothetical protein